MPLVVGIFVGGASRRMGGAPKGLLRSPDGTGSLVERLHAVALEAVPNASVMLVGAHPAYAGLGLPVLEDSPAGIGPLGGLVALLRTAMARGEDTSVLALSCDLPFVTSRLLARLATETPEAAALAPRIDGIWQPLCARYAAAPCSSAATVLVESGQRALFRVLEALGDRARELPLSESERAELRDWDTPADVR